jgi:hypothetical protein
MTCRVRSIVFLEATAIEPNKSSRKKTRITDIGIVENLNKNMLI